MKRLMIAVVAILGTMIGISAAQAGGPGCSTPVANAPAAAPSQGVAVAPQPGYRTYSYQPTTGYRTYSYQPGPAYYPSPRTSAGSGFHDAGWKARGGF